MARDSFRALGLLLRSRREAIGLGVTELARRLEIAPESVWAIERGRPPRRSTMMSYLAHVPLRAGEVLPGDASCPAATMAHWRALAEFQGFSVRECRIHLRDRGFGLELQLAMLDCAALDPKRPGSLELIARAVSRLGPRAPAVSFREHHPTEFDPLVVSAADGEHRFWLDATASRVSYEHVRPVEAARSFEIRLHSCARRLALRWEASAAPPVHVRARLSPDPVPSEHARADLLADAYPDASAPRRHDGDWQWSLEHPLPGFRYSLAEGTESPVAPLDLGGRLQLARQRASLSLRDVASRSGVSHTALTYIEGGRDPRMNTLQRLARAIPGLPPQWILPQREAFGSASLEELWAFHRDAYGYVISRLKKTVVVGHDGSSLVTIKTLGLRPTSGSLRDLHVRTGLHRAVAQVSESVLMDVESDADDLRLRLVRRAEGPVEHEFHLPSRPGRGTLSYTRRYMGPRFTLHVADWTGPADDNLEAGTSLPVFHPVELAVIEVSLPAPAAPRWQRAHAWPASFPPAAVATPLSPTWTSRSVTRRQVDSRVTLRALIQRPLIGSQLALTWGLSE